MHTSVQEIQSTQSALLRLRCEVAWVCLDRALRRFAATGFSYRTGRAFNGSSTKPSDIDLAIISRDLYERIAVIAPSRVNSKQGRTDQLGSGGKLTDDLGIADVILRARLETGQPVSIVVYRDLQTYIRRGSFVPVE